jgi:hypothetical protein
MKLTHKFAELTDKRPQDPHMDGTGLRFETMGHGGEYPDTGMHRDGPPSMFRSRKTVRWSTVWDIHWTRRMNDQDRNHDAANPTRPDHWQANRRPAVKRGRILFESVKPAAAISTCAIWARCWNMRSRYRTRPAIWRSDDRRPDSTHVIRL